MDNLLLLGKTIKVSESKVLLKYQPDDNFLDYFKIMGGTWEHQNGYLIGTELGNQGGILFTKDCYQGNVLLSFRVSTVLPATRDLNAIWCGAWNEDIDYLGDAYVCGLNGWYEEKSGIEKCSKDGFYTSTSLYKYHPGTEVLIQCGSIDGHCFLFVDGKLIVEISDEHPLTCGHVGFSPYCTKLKIRDIEIRQITWEPRSQRYEPEF